MSKGQISDFKKRQFANDLHQILSLTSSWLQKNQRFIQNIPKVFEASPITPSFDIQSLLAGVRNDHISEHDKNQLINIIQATVSGSLSSKDGLNQINGNTVNCVLALRSPTSHSTMLRFQIPVVWTGSS